MKKIISFLLLIAFAIIISSCASNKKVKFNCKPEEVSQKIIDTIQKGYSIKIPDNWHSYKGIHCALTHSPKEFKSQNYIQGKVTLSSFGNLNENSFKNLDDCINSSITSINKTFNNPKVEIRKLQHVKYGEYAILKFHSIWNSISYTRTNVIFFYKKKTYTLNFSGSNKNFNKYISDFTKIIESLKIDE